MLCHFRLTMESFRRNSLVRTSMIAPNLWVLILFDIACFGRARHDHDESLEKDI